MSEVLEEAKLVTQTMLATSVAFLDALSAFLSAFYDELTNDENKTSGTEAWSLVCSIVRWMFDDIAVHRCLTRCVDIKSGVAVSSDEVPLSLVTGPSRYGRVYHARVPTPPFDRAVYQLSPVPSSNAVFGVQRNPEEIQ
jgi:hypothetical protein